MNFEKINLAVKLVEYYYKEYKLIQKIQKYKLVQEIC